MNAPTAPLALAFALMPAALLFCLAYWRFKVIKAYTRLTIISASCGAALTALVIVVSVTYSIHVLVAMKGSIGLLAAPLLVYAGSLFTLGRTSMLPISGLVIGGAIGLVPLHFVGLYVWLLTACGFGDCI